MKEQSIGNLSTSLGVNKYKKGFATLEILIAFAILILCISAVIMIIFGNQSIAVDSEISNEAISKAQALLEKARADSGQDFNLVNPIITNENSSPYYTDKLDVETQATDSTLDLWTKRVTSTVSWQTYGRTFSTIFTTLLTNRNAENGGDTCSSVLTGDWTQPKIKNTEKDFGQLIGDSLGTYSISGIDAYKNRLYITVDNTTLKNDPTFFIFDISQPNNPILIGKLDDAKSTKKGLTAVRVAENNSNGKIYAYTASARPISGADNFGQLQIIDVSNPNLDSWNPTIIHFPVSGVSGTSGGVGNSIFYKKGNVYLGLTKTSSGPEFNIIDVHTPLTPFLVSGYFFGYSVNAIKVIGQYAYVAHETDSVASSQEQLTVLDISNSPPTRTSGYFNTAGIFNSGKSIYTVGNTIYLGRLASKILGPDDKIPEFYALNASNPKSIPSTPLGTIPLATPESLHGLIVRDFLAFFTTTNKFQIWNISQLSTPLLLTSLNLPASGGDTTPTSDCEGNYFYIGSNDKTTNKGYLTIITSQ